MSALATKLEKLEKALTPATKFFSVRQTKIILLNGSSKVLPIADGEMDRVKSEGYRAGLDQLVVRWEFVRENNAELERVR
jgi:hypothetical protein